MPTLAPACAPPLPDTRIDASLLSASKAELLHSIAPSLRLACVPYGRIVERHRWQHAREATLAEFIRGLKGQPAAVRSSHPQEDRIGRSQAGRFLTRLDVEPDAIGDAVDAVFASYGEADPGDQVLLQRSLGPVDAALVACTRAPPEGADYVSVSIAHGQSTRAVTDGSAAADTWYVAAEASPDKLPAPVAAALAVVREVQAYMPSAVDFELELAWMRSRIWLLQVRPIALPACDGVSATRRKRRAVAAMLARLGCSGTPLLGLMPDWNPAELLGEHPRPLALSLFQSLIGDGAWWQARCSLGYARPLRPRLLCPLAGRPYVDNAASLSSFIPGGLPPAVTRRLLKGWTGYLASHRHLHDRVEFDVAVTALEFDLRQRLAFAGVDRSDADLLSEALRPITLRCLDHRRVASLLSAFEAFGEGLRHARVDPLWIRVGRVRERLAIPFATAARCDFAAQALLRSAVRRGALAAERLEALLCSAGSTAGRLAEGDGYRRCRANARAGTFDIRSLRHADLPLRPSSTEAAERGQRFVLRTHERRELDRLLTEAGLTLSADRLVEAALLAARARELGKFVFAAEVSELLEIVARRAAGVGLGRDEASWTPWQVWCNVEGSATDPAAEARERHRTESLLRMPALIQVGDSLDAVCSSQQRPSYIGSGCVSAPLATVGSGSAPGSLPVASIVAIEAADPGFDWIFERAPAALLTAWGGPHSHMALRCRDLGCPAVLGVGIERFSRLTRAARLSIDFSTGAIHAI